ncbi:ribosomal protein L7/L12 [Nocardioides daejeonensis]|uniref:ribosomal protein L7/L12 n=1 Tax=Nocardioides daejeonensis TaxID=1046556 RepID=UPI000D7461C6|nr:ribosomal protein L7/L12 [Nocardioides daejeonensis]
MGIFSGGEVSRDEFERLARRVEQLERTVAALSLQQGGGYAGGSTAAAGSSSAPGGPDLTEVMALKQQGKLIHAIKLYRELTGLGLKEAKEAVERL